MGNDMVDVIGTDKLLESLRVPEGAYYRNGSVKVDTIGVSVRDGHMTITCYLDGEFVLEVRDPKRFIDGAEHKLTLYDSNIHVRLSRDTGA